MPSFPKISQANSKTGIESFNIDNTVCKNISGCKKQGCLKHCYYNKIKRIYPQQVKFLQNNLKATKLKGFADLMIKELDKVNCRYFRIHSCGEFYSQKYFNDWVKIAKAHPDIIFYTYTKNISLDVTKRPKNFILYLSDDLNIWSVHHKKYNGIARIKEKNEPIFNGFVQCMNQTQGLKCIECKLCIKGKNAKVCFNKH